MITYVYVAISEFKNSVKVGISFNPEQRRRNLRCPRGGKAKRLLFVMPHSQANLVEERAHLILSMQGKYIGREWFSATPKEAISAVMKAAGEIPTEEITSAQVAKKVGASVAFLNNHLGPRWKAREAAEPKKGAR